MKVYTIVEFNSEGECSVTTFANETDAKVNLLSFVDALRERNPGKNFYNLPGECFCVLDPNDEHVFEQVELVESEVICC